MSFNRMKILTFMLVLFLFGCSEKISEKEYFDRAQLLEQNEEYDEAIETYLSIYKKFPGGELGDESLFRSAIIQANILRHHEDAIKTHDRLLRAFPESDYAHQSFFMKGFIYANDIKDFEKAKNIYKEFLEKYPNSELATSVEWEINNLGKDINEIEFLGADKVDSNTVRTQ